MTVIDKKQSITAMDRQFALVILMIVFPLA